MKWIYLLAFMSAGCLANAWSDLQDNFTTTATTGGSSTTSGTVPTTSDGANSIPVATVTGPPDESSSAATTLQEPETTTGDMINLPPTIELFTVTPKDPNEKQLSEAGPAELQLVASDDVVKVRLSLDGVELAELKPSDFPRDWEALSAKDNGLAREFEVVVEDAEGLTAKATDHIDVQLPQTGAEKCSFDDPGKGAVTSVISALKYTPDAIVATGTRDTGAGLRLTVWKLDPDCKLLTGWPRSIVDWTAKPTFKTMTSLGAAVDVDEAGNIIVAGNFVVGGKLQSYVARLTPDGARQWEQDGQVGDEVRGVAGATAQFKNRVFVVGAQRTSDVPVRTDGAVWVYIADGKSVFIQPPVILKAPFTPEETDQDENNERSEKLHAVVIQPGTGNAMAVGEREFWPDDFNVYSRAFTSSSTRSVMWWGRRGPRMGLRFATMQSARSASAATRYWPGDGPATILTRRRSPSRWYSGWEPTSIAIFPNSARRRSTASLAIWSTRSSAQAPACWLRRMLRSSPSRGSSTCLPGMRPVSPMTMVPVRWPATGEVSAGGVATERPTRSPTRSCGFITRSKRSLARRHEVVAEVDEVSETCSAKNGA
jgi:hypothetical protein